MRQVNLRLLIAGLFIALPLLGLYIWMRTRPIDRPWVVIPPVDSKGMIAALMETPDGRTRLVSIAPDGKIREVKGPQQADDKELSWEFPAGDRIVFVSNRASDGSYQLFDWIPDRDSEPFQLTKNGASRSNPWASPKGDILFASRGEILKIAMPSLRVSRVFPPGDEPEAQQETEEGLPTIPHKESHNLHDRIGQAWKSVSGALEGEAFESGYVDASGKYFAGVYVTARGQALVIQNLRPETEVEALPVVPFAGERIEVAMHPSRPMIVVAVRNFRYPMPSQIPPDRINKDGTIKRDWVNALIAIYLDGTRQPEMLFSSADGSNALVEPTLSPDGSELAVVVLQKEQAGKTSTLGIAISRLGEQSETSFVVRGDVAEPAWSADASMIAFVRNGDIWTVRRDGTGETNVTKGRSRFSSPEFSPMH